MTNVGYYKMESHKSNHLTELEKSLPAYYYFSDNHYSKEVTAIWKNNWIYVCHESRITANLSFLTVEISDQNIIIFRSSKGELKAYYNTCRHRGSILCDQKSGSMSSKLLSCPYHQWSYSIDTGQLINIASFSNTPSGFNKNDLGLFEVSIQVWRGLIFVNLNESATWDLDNLFQRKPSAFENFPLEDMVCGHVWEKTIECNWKSFWENFNECLHCPNIHPELTDLVPMFSNRIINPMDLSSWEPKTEKSNPKFSGGLKSGAETWSTDGSAQGNKIKNLTREDLLKGHVYASSWPSMFIGGYADHVRAVRVLPIHSEKTMITAEWFFEKSALKDDKYDMQNVIDFACLVMEQDANACELNQKGLKSMPYQNGFLMPEEYVIKTFHDWIRKELSQSP